MKNLKQQTMQGTTWLCGMVLLAVFLLLVTSCTAPPPSGSLYEALFNETGYRLGGDASSGVANAECAAESRYDGANGPVQLLVCVAPLENKAGRIRYRISYTPPEAGHLIWKIDASIPDKTLQNLGILRALEQKYGSAQIQADGQTLKWQADAAYLEIREDRYGVQFLLWDRSLRQS